MQISIAFIGILVVIVIVWVVAELKRKGVTFGHRFFAIFIILLLLFSYFSFTFVLQGKGLNLSTWDGLRQAGTIYYSWLASVFGNFKTLTANAINMNWGVNNSTSLNITSANLSNSS